KVKSCDNITLNDECTADIYLDGEISGKGINSKQDFDSPFIKEYSTGQTGCTQLNDPIFGGYDLGIDLSSCGFTPTVNATPQPPVCAGEDITLSVLNPLANKIYQWQKLAGSTWTNISSATGVSYTIEGAQATDAGKYRVVLINAEC